MHKNAFFLLKNCKNRPTLGASPPNPQLPAATLNGFRRLEALPPPTPPPQKKRIPGYVIDDST